MKSSFLQDIKHSVVRGTFFGISAIWTIAIVVVVYAATTSYPDISTVWTGSGLTVTAWNNLVNYTNKAVKQETEVLTVTGGKVGVGVFTPSVTLDVNGSISSQGPAWEATRTTTLSIPSGWNTTITSFTTNASVTIGGGFNPSTGIFQPTIPGRYLFTLYGYSGTQGNWAAWISKNGSTGVTAGAVPVINNGNIANASYVANLNGTSDSVYFIITNYSWSTANLTSVVATWTKLP